jgi:purine-binding chemotaxis protein CheW
MDILSIRKKKAAEAAARLHDAESNPTSSSSPRSSSTLPPTVLPTETEPVGSTSPMSPPVHGSTRSPSSSHSGASGHVASTVPSPSGNPAGRDAALTHTTAPTAAVVDDPLREFLAEYDDDDDGIQDFGERRGAVESTERFLAFQLQGESYVASIMDVHEILKVRRLTDVPRAPPAILGVLSKRGVVLPVVDLAVLLGLRGPDRRLSARQRVLVVGAGERICGLRVDSVAEVVKLQHDHLESVPPSLGARNAGLLVGLGRVGAAMYIVLDLKAVLDSFAASLGLSPTRREMST